MADLALAHRAGELGVDQRPGARPEQVDVVLPRQRGDAEQGDDLGEVAEAVGGVEPVGAPEAVDVLLAGVELEGAHVEHGGHDRGRVLRPRRRQQVEQRVEGCHHFTVTPATVKVWPAWAVKAAPPGATSTNVSPSVKRTSSVSASSW